MTINIGAGVQAYANAAKQLTKPEGATATDTVKGTGGGFGDMLQNAIKGAVDTQKQAETASVDAINGKADIGNVVTAVNNAELTLQTVLAVRDKVLAAYTEIMHMAV